MVLWDVGSKRGWLVNGPSALLHLLRASLRSNQVDDLSFAFLFDPATFEEAKAPYTVSAALQVLMNPRNLDLALYEDDSEGCSKPHYYRVRDRLNDLYEVVEKMLDYQIMICGKDGVKLRDVPRRYLEGWDFKDIATKEDPIYPRLAKLKTIGKGWVDFIRATQAVVLFGRDLGDLVEPSATNDLCSHWRTLPCDRYYLAACMGDLKRVFDRSGHLLFMHSGPTSLFGILLNRHLVRGAVTSKMGIFLVSPRGQYGENPLRSGSWKTPPTLELWFSATVPSLNGSGGTQENPNEEAFPSRMKNQTAMIKLIAGSVRVSGRRRFPSVRGAWRDQISLDLHTKTVGSLSSARSLRSYLL
jgi:hypothetical protein